MILSLTFQFHSNWGWNMDLRMNLRPKTGWLFTCNLLLECILVWCIHCWGLQLGVFSFIYAVTTKVIRSIHILCQTNVITDSSECSFLDCIRIKTCYQVITIMTIWNFPVHMKPIWLGTSSKVLLCKGITPMISKSDQKLLSTNPPNNPKSDFMTSCERGPLGGHNWVASGWRVEFDQWPLPDIIGTWERFCHIFRNFVQFW